MRELKFRAWDKAKKKMLYGVSIGTIKIWDENAPLLSYEFSYSEDCIFEQYTGLKDKNGKEIYEGDIVRYGRHLSGIIPPESRTAVVKWWSGEEEYYPCCTASGFSLPFSEDGYEVIGNIHENPELIGKEQ